MEDPTGGRRELIRAPLQNKRGVTSLEHLIDLPASPSLHACSRATDTTVWQMPGNNKLVFPPVIKFEWTCPALEFFCSCELVRALIFGNCDIFAPDHPCDLVKAPLAGGDPGPGRLRLKKGSRTAQERRNHPGGGNYATLAFWGELFYNCHYERKRIT